MPTYLIPNGPKNLLNIFPSVIWKDIAEYYIEVSDAVGDILASTSINKISDYYSDDAIRIHFINYLGHLDGLDFMKPKVVHEDTASEFQKSLSFPLKKTDAAIERFNIKSNDTYEAKRKCTEEEMEWLQECFDTPKLLIEWKGIEGQSDDYLPVVKIASKFDKLKNDKEFDYEFVIQFKLANDFQIIRN